MASCERLGWTQDDQDGDNPCTCGLDTGHEGLHQCKEGCGGEWAGGRSPLRATLAEQHTTALAEQSKRFTETPMNSDDGRDE